MDKFNGVFITGGPDMPSLRYQVLSGIGEYDDKCGCIVVQTLSPDYYLLFGSVRLIVTEHGGALSHLAILGREYGIPIFRSEDITDKIPRQGTLSIDGSVMKVEPDEKGG